ncbi:MAG TPA: hypothetical protein P5554_11805, partial [Spirochaetota bacterium]|nr:hypothetical protein [Spirochaetota bacterium]
VSNISQLRAFVQNFLCSFQRKNTFVTASSSVILSECPALSLPKGKNLSVIAICHSERSEESLCHYMQFSLSS